MAEDTDDLNRFSVERFTVDYPTLEPELRAMFVLGSFMDDMMDRETMHGLTVEQQARVTYWFYSKYGGPTK